MRVPYKPINVPSPPKMPEPILISSYLGVDFNNDPTQIDNRRSPDMKNMIINGQGILDKRTGYSKVYTTNLGTSKPIRGLFLYKKTDGNLVRLVACNGNLYTWDDSGDQPTSIKSGLADADMTSFQMNGKIYFMNGTDFIQWDGTTVSDVTASAYVPTLTMGREPTGGGTAFEQFNLLGTGFKDSFSGNASATVYTLSLSGLDATLVSVSIGGVAKTEGTSFTVDRTAGTVNFAAGTSPHGAPASGTDNVIITAYKTVSGYADRIKKCRFSALFGGENDTRVFVSGNTTANYWNIDWRSGLNDPTYFPDNGFVKVGLDNEKITGYSKQYDYLIVHKEYSTWNRVYSTDADGIAIFPIKPVSDSIGAISSKTIAIINNSPVVLSSKNGVQQLNQGTVRDERNYTHLSLNVDNVLLSESTLANAVAIDYGGKYILSVNGNCYVLDYVNATEPSESNPYGIGEWFYWTNIYASCFLEYNGYLYFGDSEKGMIYKFKKESEINAYADVTTAIDAYRKSKRFSMNTHFYKKNVDKVFVTLLSAYAASADIYYESDNVTSDLINTVSSYLFSYINFNYTNFTYKSTIFPQTARNKLKAKKIVYFQLIVKNNNLNESMPMVAEEIHYMYVSEVK